MDTTEIDKGQLDNIIDKAMTNYREVSKEEIYKGIGVSLMGLDLEPNSNMASKYILKPRKDFNLEREFFGSKEGYVDIISREIPAEDAKKVGKNFWEIFKQKARANICGDEGILHLLKEGKVKEALEKVIPSLLILMGMSGLNPLSFVIAGVAMLLLKAGIETLCESEK